MTTDQMDTQQQIWGEPNSSPRRWGWRESAAAIGVAAVIAALGGAAIYAATAGNSHSFGGRHQAFSPGGMPGGPGGPGAQHDPMSGPADVASPSLHGEFVEPSGPGSYTTVVTQTGTVTAISPTSISVRSEDGFNQTYVIPSTAGNAGAPFAVDNQVTVRATRNGQTLTVTNIGNPPQDGFPGLGGPGGPPHRN
jgi:hypothetical protein